VRGVHDSHRRAADALVHHARFGGSGEADYHHRSHWKQSWNEGSETWRVLRAYFPGSVETHNLVQDFFFGEDLTLRRHDYTVNVAGGLTAAQLTSDYTVANGIRLPTKRRAYARGSDRRPILELLMVSIDLSEVRFS
jgi:hypothetical protein